MMPKQLFRQVFFAALFLLAHISAALIALRFMSGNGIVASFWPPTGIAIASLLLGGLKYAPLTFVGAVTANLLTGTSWHAAAFFGAGNVTEALLGYTLLRYLRPVDLKLDRAQDYFRIFLYGGILSPLPSALIGATTLQITGLTQDSWLHNFQFWWMGDSLGVMTMTPLMLIWRRFERYELKRSQVIEGILVSGLAFLTGQVTFMGWFHETIRYEPRAFTMIVFLIWAGVRFGRHATLFILVMIIVQLLMGSMHYFAGTGRQVELFNTWLYIAVLSVTGMALATFIHERKKSLESLAHITENLEQVSATAHIGGWELDVETMQIWFSREALRIVEADPKRQLTINEAIDFIEPDERGAHEARVRLAIEFGTAWDVEFGMTTTSGRSIWVRSQGTPFYKESRVVKLTGTVHDITEKKKADQVISESNERLSLIFRTLSEGVALNEAVLNGKGEFIDHRVIEVNDAFYKIADLRKDVRVQGALATELYGLTPEMVRDFWEKHQNIRETVESEFFSAPSGRHFLVSTSPLYKGKFVTSFFDITERKKTELALRESEQRYRKLVESSADAILVHQGGIIVYANPAALRILRAPDATQLLHGNMREIIPLEHRAMILEKYAEADSTITPLREGKLRCLDGTLIDVEVSATATTFDGRPSTLIVARDISERKRAEEEIRYLGQHDILTQLPNRALFADRLSQLIALSSAHKSTFALLFLDVDHFKKINDSLGHHVGDLFLKEIAGRLIGSVKNIDTVSRQGGDEFLLLLNELPHPEDAAVVAQKICAALTAPVVVEKSRINASVSIGVAVYPRDGTNAETLIKNADIAMYHAKDSGRNQFQFYSEDLNRITHENLEIETALRDAMNLGQLKVYYQPQLDLITGKIESCEALLRWIHPERGFIPPSRFIPIAEESGQILEIGRWVLRTVAENYRAMAEAGYPELRISVNVSAEEIQNPDFTTHLKQTIADGTIPASALEFEVTESMIMQDTTKAIHAIHDLSSLGVRFSIDDFGTGYSSLSYLRQLKIHNLKIDQSFVRDLMTDPDDAAIVRTIIGLAKNLRLKVTAEGVETEEQRAFLKDNGCDIIQGYEFSEALPLTKFLLFLQTHSLKTTKARQKKQRL
jgi:diguanylate cyclase (GGDEF)-like protein/PAS domain S-box-containing protein